MPVHLCAEPRLYVRVLNDAYVRTRARVCAMREIEGAYICTRACIRIETRTFEKFDSLLFPRDLPTRLLRTGREKSQERIVFESLVGDFACTRRNSGMGQSKLGSSDKFLRCRRTAGVESRENLIHLPMYTSDRFYLRFRTFFPILVANFPPPRETRQIL